ncbi:hypothetical protein SARC_00943 [Sphaeroforma arctica JP610]|uniref:Uncharacterized protein n=1 Tax=Sphaeroforma arctica JP610 TaxID=667725 RepID=A0A0L0GDH8_9EUKA|nr:hypothetical protein SARC_00943 [Sphaeroforma arctica JP610]KNC86941.1 hypothetical protein SARC_00943 [Sphaeroforma arctica JP610]|eukprot:XP_014160843.1 hypothetical protein SARC_00943 [Sphaeroforma arctica JP610]
MSRCYDHLDPLMVPAEQRLGYGKIHFQDLLYRRTQRCWYNTHGWDVFAADLNDKHCFGNSPFGIMDNALYHIATFRNVSVVSCVPFWESPVAAPFRYVCHPIITNEEDTFLLGGKRTVGLPPWKTHCSPMLKVGLKKSNSAIAFIWHVGHQFRSVSCFSATTRAQAEADAVLAAEAKTSPAVVCITADDEHEVSDTAATLQSVVSTDVTDPPITTEGSTHEPGDTQPAPVHTSHGGNIVLGDDLCKQAQGILSAPYPIPDTPSTRLLNMSFPH